jgi:TonB family protein
LEKKKYHEAIELLTVSIADHPTANAYFNRAVAYYNLGDSCSFCDDLINAGSLHDRQAESLYQAKCMYSVLMKEIPDSILQENPDVNLIEMRYHKCLPDSSIHYITRFNTDWRPGIVTNPEIVNVNTDTMEVFTVVEQMPEFNKNWKSIYEYLGVTIQYPEEAREKSIEGKVYVNYIVLADGRVANVWVMKGIGFGCDEEAVRIVQSTPRWIPGKQRGKNVPVRMNLMVTFKLG